MKCFSRNIKLKNLFRFQDKKNKGYIEAQIAMEMINDLPIGFSQSEIDNIFSYFYLFDENNKYMYNSLFDTDEYLISKIISYSPLIQKDKNSFSCKCENFNDTKSEIILENEVSNHIINSIFNKRELTDILYLKTSNIIFVIAPFNKHIYIFKRETKLTNMPECLQKIGIINLKSFYKNSPGFMYFIEERNLLITQKTEEKSTELVFINIYEDLIFPFRNKKYIEYNVEQNLKNVSKNLFPFKEGEPILIEKFFYKKQFILIYVKDFVRIQMKKWDNLF